MRCGCPHCETFMVQAEDKANACVCPYCGYRCNACLGTGTALTQEDIARLRCTEWITPSFDALPDDDDFPDATAPERPDGPVEF